MRRSLLVLAAAQPFFLATLLLVYAARLVPLVSHGSALPVAQLLVLLAAGTLALLLAGALFWAAFHLLTHRAARGLGMLSAICLTLLGALLAHDSNYDLWHQVLHPGTPALTGLATALFGTVGMVCFVLVTLRLSPKRK